MEVLYELPDSTPARLQRITPHLTTQEQTFLALRLPRRAYALSLRLPHGVEPGSASAQLFSDHMSVRQPLLHPGSAIPERELRAGRRLPCNVCRGALLLQPGATAAAAGGGGAPVVLLTRRCVPIFCLLSTG